MKTVSIIIPTFNEEAYLPGLLEAIRRQSRPPLESYSYLVANYWIIPVVFLISAVLTYLWYAYMEYKWPFHRPKGRW